MTTFESSINDLITGLKQSGKLDTNLISDGYHNFGELYQHRIQLWIALCWEYSKRSPKNSSELGLLEKTDNPWRTEKHSDGSSFAGWFVLGYGKEKGDQITYHLPMEYWDQCNFATTLEKAPEFDGHSSNDVLERLKKTK